MKYSYIKPQAKSAFTQEVQLLLSFFAITIMMLLLTYMFLLYKNHTFSAQKKEYEVQEQKLHETLDVMEKDIDYIEKQKTTSESISTKNIVLKDSIANLFDLVPLRITLTEAKLMKNGLVLYGLTPNKDVYNFMLEAPLRSIFHRSYSSFHPAQNGWYRFVSTNYIDEEELLYEE